MQNPSVSPISASAVLIRLLIALVLGLQFCLVIWLNAKSSSLPWSIWIPVAVLFGAMLLSVLFAPQVRQGEVSPGGVILAMLKALLVVGLPLLLALVLQSFNFPLALAIIPLEIGIIAAFTLGSGNIPLSIGVGATLWLGIAFALVIVASAQANAPGNDFGGLVLSLVIVGATIGFGVAALGGLLGRFLYGWALQ
jgi:hypothetical protein